MNDERRQDVLTNTSRVCLVNVVPDAVIDPGDHMVDYLVLPRILAQIARRTG